MNVYANGFRSKISPCQVLNIKLERHYFISKGTIAPARETSEKENPLLAMLMNLNLVVPAAAAIMVIIAAIVVICVIKGRNNGHKGLLWLSCYSVHLLFHFHFV